MGMMCILSAKYYIIFISTHAIPEVQMIRLSIFCKIFTVPAMW